MAFKYRVKRPDGSFTEHFDTPAEAVAKACDYVTIPWREGVEAVTRFDKNMTSIHIFKDPVTGDFCGVDRIMVEDDITYNLYVAFNDEGDRARAQALIESNFTQVTCTRSDQGPLGKLLEK